MTASVLSLQPGWLNLGVNLRRGQTGMAEQLLDAPQVRAALQQMGRKRVAQGVRRDAAGDCGLADPPLQPPAHVRGVQAPPALRDEQSVLAARTDEGRASTLEVAAERGLRGLA